jgi:hypothetical protein
MTLMVMIIMILFLIITICECRRHQRTKSMNNLARYYGVPFSLLRPTGDLPVGPSFCHHESTFSKKQRRNIKPLSELREHILL